MGRDAYNSYKKGAKNVIMDGDQTKWSELAQREGFYNENQKPVVSERPVQDDDSRSIVSSDIRWNFDRTTMWFRGVRFKQIPNVPVYYISKKGVVKNVSGHTLRSRITSSQTQVQLQVGGRGINFYRKDLISQAWPELAPKIVGDSIFLDGEEYKVIPSFPNYLISRKGVVRRIKNMNVHRLHNGRVSLTRDGKQWMRSVKNLYLEAFGNLPEEMLWKKWREME